METTQKTILLVEDDFELGELFSKAITEAGYTVLRASDGEDGLTKALSEHPSLVVLDIVMPKMDGMTVLAKLHENPAGRDIPVIVFSNYGIPETEDAAMRQGACKYLNKVDATPQELVKAIAECLDPEFLKRREGLVTPGKTPPEELQ